MPCGHSVTIAAIGSGHFGFSLLHFCPSVPLWLARYVFILSVSHFVIGFRSFSAQSQIVESFGERWRRHVVGSGILRFLTLTHASTVIA